MRPWERGVLLSLPLVFAVYADGKDADDGARPVKQALVYVQDKISKAGLQHGDLKKQRGQIAGTRLRPGIGSFAAAHDVSSNPRITPRTVTPSPYSQIARRKVNWGCRPDTGGLPQSHRQGLTTSRRLRCA